MQQKTRTRNPGVKVDVPSKSCDDKNCPFHGSLKLRGKSFIGKVISSKMQRSAVVSWEGKIFVPKFERYKKTRTKVAVHNPDCVNAQEGDLVKIHECRPLSKRKHFVIAKVLGKKGGYLLEKQLEEEGKHKLKKKEIANIEFAKKPKEEKKE
ncbi:MAG: 30S ribosomal protein S17 [Nanoarchaeota archaeon]|nr:30S ribosomal protein S17 [Nanoarchaeota archaeon]